MSKAALDACPAFLINRPVSTLTQRFDRLPGSVNQLLTDTRNPLVIHAPGGVNKGTTLLLAELGHLYTTLLNRCQTFMLLLTGSRGFPCTCFNGGLTQDLALLVGKSLPNMLADSKDQRVIHVVPQRQVLLTHLVNTCLVED